MIENTQRAVPADHRGNGDLYVHSIFKTIQGEGPFCGERALFIRLWGCNLQCPGCDTEYTAVKEDLTPAQLVFSVSSNYEWPHGALIVITGGEPLRQNIVPAITALIDAGYRVQIETNGVLWIPGLESQLGRFVGQDDAAALTIVCAPKTKKIHGMIFTLADAFKYVISAGDVNPDDGLPYRALRHKAAPEVARPRPGALVYVQPMDEQDEAMNALNLEAAVKSTMEHGHRLQIQIHKIINME